MSRNLIQGTAMFALPSGRCFACFVNETQTFSPRLQLVSEKISQTTMVFGTTGPGEPQSSKDGV